MSDDEFDDFSIDDAALVQIDSLEQTVSGAHRSKFPNTTVASGSSTWSTIRKPPAGKAPAFQLRTLPLQGSSSSESGGVSAVSAGVRPPVDMGTSGSKALQGRSNSVVRIDQRNAVFSGKDVNAASKGKNANVGNAIEILSDDDDEFEVLSPPATVRTISGSNANGGPAVSGAEAARIARANAIRGLTGGANAAMNWLTTAQGNRATSMGGKAITKQPNQKNVKVTEWDPEKPQTQVVQTHLPFRPITPRKTGKTWDRTAYSKSGQRVVKKGASAKKKGKKKQGGYWDDEVSDDQEDEEEEEEEEDGFDQFPMPFIDPSKCMSVRYREKVADRDSFAHV